MSFAASANVVARLRARPVFVDIDLYTRNLNVDLIEAAISRKTRAIMPVHFAGLPVDMDALYGIAAARGLRVPLVVRLAGTNVDEGRRILRDSGLPIITADTLADAAAKAVAAARSVA